MYEIWIVFDNDYTKRQHYTVCHSIEAARAIWDLLKSQEDRGIQVTSTRP